VAANALYITEAAITYMGVRVPKGTTIALTASQVSAIGASNLRAVSAPVGVNGTAPASATHDTLGEAAGVSNSS
jgi:hypothetical protein